MNNNLYRLKGYVFPTSKPFGFVMPFFVFRDAYFTQIIGDNGFISEFVSISIPPDESQLASKASIALCVGQNPLYVFAFRESNIVYGDKGSLSTILNDRFNELKTHPFIALEVLSFLERYDEALQTLPEVHRILCKHDEHIAEMWLTNKKREIIALHEHSLKFHVSLENIGMTNTINSEYELRDVLLDIATCHELEELFRIIITYLTSSIKDSGCSIFEVDHSSNQLRMVASSTIPVNEFHKCTYNSGEGFTGWVLQEGRFLHVPFHDGDYSLEGIEPRPIHKGKEGGKPCETRSVGPFMAAPIMRKGYVIGVIRMPCTRGERSSYSEDEGRLFRTFALRLSESMELANQFHKHDQLIQTYSRLGELRNLESLDSVVKDIPKIVGGGGCSVFIAPDSVDGEKKLYVLKASTSVKEGFQEYRKRVKAYYYEEHGIGITAWVATTGIPVMLDDIDNEDEIAKLNCDGYSAKHIPEGPCEIDDVGPFLVVPIKYEDKVIGVIRIPRRKGSKPFEDLDKKLLMALADHLGLIIKNIDKNNDIRKLELIKQKEFDGLFPPVLLNHLRSIRTLDYGEDLLNICKMTLLSRDLKEEISTVLRNMWRKTYKHKHKFSFPLIEHFKDYETLLFQLPGYRDHFYHQFQVFLLGTVIIDMLNQADGAFNKCYNKLLCLDENDRSSAGLAWMIASTFHDVAYPIEKSHVLFNQFFEKFMDLGNVVSDRLELSQILTNRAYLDLIHQLCDFQAFLAMPGKCKGWHSQPFERKHLFIDSFFETGLLKCLFENRDHGVLGALMLLYKSQIQQDQYAGVILPAALAVALHKGLFTRLREKVVFEENPLAFLLIYCDLVQEWGRQSSGKSSSPELNEITGERCDGKVVITTSISIGDHALAHKKAAEAEDVFRKLSASEFEFRFVIGDINSHHTSTPSHWGE